MIVFKVLKEILQLVKFYKNECEVRKFLYKNEIINKYKSIRKILSSFVIRCQQEYEGWNEIRMKRVNVINKNNYL